MAHPAGFFSLVAAFRFSSVADAIEVRFTARASAHRRPGASGRERLGGAIRQLRAVAPCTRSGTVAIATDGDA
jgi:hypothetical protein